MDLRFCPACKQSVLDDDAADCPFCGASMSSKPSAGGPKKPAPSSGGKPAPSKKPKPKPKPKPKAKPEPADDDPFAVDQTAALKAIQATPKPVKGRLHKVTCPMCETVGFIPKKAVGRDIRCANKECMVPVFKAQAKKPKGDPRVSASMPVEESSAKSPLLVYGGVAALVIATGIGVLFLVKDNDKPNNLDVPFDTSIGRPKVEEYDPNAKPKQPTVAAVVKKTDYRAVREQIIADMIGAARDSTRTRKPYCRRLTADAHAIAGNFAAANKELDQLTRVDKRLGYYRIQPWSRMAIEQIKTGDSATAKQSTDLALSAAGDLPRFGRTPIDLVTALAAALVSSNRDAEAAALLKRHSRDRSIEANVSESLLSAQLVLQRELQIVGLVGSAAPDPTAWTDPQRAVVAGIVMLNGFSSRAIEWSMTQDATTKADCVALCAELAAMQLLESDSRTSLDQLTSAVSVEPMSGLVKSVAARVLAGSEKHADVAKQMFSEAQTAFTAIPDVKSPTAPGYKQSLNYKLPGSGNLRTATLLGINLTCASGKLAPDQAASLLDRTVSFPKAFAPPFSVSKKRLDDAVNNSGQIKAQLRRVMNTSSDGLRLAVRQYREIWETIFEASETRRQLLASVVRRVADAGLQKQVWDIIPTLKSDDIMATDSVWHVVDAYLAAGMKPEMEKVFSELRADKRSLSPLGSLSRNLDVQLRNGQIDRALKTAESATASLTDRSVAIVNATMKNTQEDRLASVLKFAKGLKHAPLREETLDLVAAQAQRFKDQAEVRNLIDKTNFSASDRCAAYHGLTIGVGQHITTNQPETQPGG